MMNATKTEQREAKQFLDFVDDVAVTLYGAPYDELTPPQQLATLTEVENIHMAQVN